MLLTWINSNSATWPGPLAITTPSLFYSLFINHYFFLEKKSIIIIIIIIIIKVSKKNKKGVDKKIEKCVDKKYKKVDQKKKKKFDQKKKKKRRRLKKKKITKKTITPSIHHQIRSFLSQNTRQDPLYFLHKIFSPQRTCFRAPGPPV
jgi:hypothetical protein